MPRFPTYERQVGLSGGSTASYASEGAFTAPARALANLGGAVADIGADISAREQKIRQTQDDTWFSKARAQTAIDMLTQEQELQKSATEGARDYTPKVRGAFDTYRKQKVATAPSPRAQQMYDEWANTYDVQLTGRAAGFQAQSELAQRTSDFAEAMTAHAQTIFADPSQYEAVRKRAMDDFEGAKQWMTPEQETAAREKVDHDLKLARAKSLVEFSPADFQREVTGGPEAWRGAISSIESGGRYDAVGPTHPTLGRALGKYQIMEANITRWSKEALGRAVTSEEFLASPKIQDAIFDHKFGGYVEKFGLEGAAQAWFAGEGGVGKTDRKDVLGTDVGSYGKRFMAALRKGGFASDPRFAGLSVDEIRSLSNQADTAINAQQATAYAQMKDAIDLGIADGSVLSEDQILGSGLNDGDKAVFLRRFREERKDEIAAMETIAALNDRSLSIDAYDTDARKNIDNAAGMLKKHAKSPEQYQSATEEIVRQSGIVPKDVVNAIRRGLESQNPAEVAAAAQQASRISQIDPAALGRREGGKEVQNAADDFSHYVNDLNMTPEEAGKRIRDANDPEKKRDRKVLEPAAKEFLKELEEFSLAGEFDTFFGSEPSVGFSAGQELGIKAEFMAIAEDAFYSSNGDPDVAQNRAVEQMKRLYGVTELTGRKVLMKHPPEKYWPSFPIADAAQSLSYPAQLEADIREFSPDVDMSSVQLVTTPETDAMVKRGEMPGYAVLYKDENGVLQTIPGKLWKPDISKLKAMQGTVDAVEQQRKVDAAKADQVQKKQQAPFRDLKPEDFLSGNDPVFGAR